MIRCASRVGLTSFKRVRPYRWASSTPVPLALRSLSSGPVPATEDTWTHSTTQTWEPEHKTSKRQQDAADPIRRHGGPSMDKAYACAMKSVRGNELDPKIVDLMVDAIEGRTQGVAAEDILKVVGKVFKDGRCSTLTVQLLERFQQQVGEPFTPSTPGGLVTILAAMRPTISSTRQPSRAEVLERSHKVAALLEQYEAGGQVVPMTGFQAAILAVGGRSDCTYAKELAREAREKLGVLPGLRDVYNVVIQQARDNKLPDVIIEVLEEMVEVGGELAPCSASYRAALAGLVKANRAQQVMEVYDGMQKMRIMGDKLAMGSVLAASARDPSYWEDALGIIQMMRRQDGEHAPDVSHYTSAVTSCIKARRWKEAVGLLDLMEEDGVAPTDRLLDHIMQATIQAKQWALAEGLFRAMTEKYGHGSIVSYQSMWHFVEAMVMQKKMRKAINCVARVYRFKMLGRKQEDALDTRLLRCFRRIPGVTGQALASVLMAMADKGIEIHPDSYALVIGHANKEGESELALSLYENLVANGKGTSVKAVNAVIKSCKDLDQAGNFMASLKEHGLEADSVTYSAMLHTCCATEDDICDDGSGGDDGVSELAESKRVRRAERAMEIWQDVQSQGRVNRMVLVPYLRALMAGGMWELALRERQRHRDVLGDGHEQPDLVKLGVKLGGADAVADAVVCHGLVDNGQPGLALEEVQRVLRSRCKAEDIDPHYVDEDNHVVLAGIRACAETDSWETAVRCLEWSESRWSRRPLLDGQGEDWLLMSKQARASRRRLYDATLCLLDSKKAPWSEVRRVLERGMRHGAVCLVKDSGSRRDELSIDFHVWGIPSARLVLRCILEDLIEEKDFLHSKSQYELAELVHEEALREFNGDTGRWHSDSPDPRGRARDFVDGLRPSRFAERAYRRGGKGGTGPSATGESEPREPADHECWWKKGERLSIVVGKVRPRPSIRHELEDFCTLRLQPPLRIKVDSRNKSVLTLEPADVSAWLSQNPTILDDE